VYGELTQGTVFNCVDQPRYEGRSAFGLTITARCDVAQGKFPVLNYLPLVHLGDWLRRDGLEILIENELAEQAGTLSSILKSIGISPSILSTVTLPEIDKIHFSGDSIGKSAKNAREKFNELCKVKEDFEERLKTQDMEKQFAWFQDHRPGKIEELIKRLSRHQVLGHYLLESISLEDSERTGFVCLMREVSTLPKRIAQKIATGLSGEAIEEICKLGSNRLGLTVPIGELAMPIIQIGSPTIEHILQAFSSLFGRIGVADPNEEDVGRIVRDCVGLEKSGDNKR
jgi:hypothetical protein